MTSYSTPANQPYSLHLHRNGQVEIIYHQAPRASRPTSGPGHASTTAPTGSPRSLAATFGSANTRIAGPDTRRESPPTSSTTKHRVPESSSRHPHHHHASEPHRSTGHHSSSPSSGERHRHNSTSRLEKPSLPIPIPGRHQHQHHEPEPHRDSSASSHSHSRSRSHSHSTTASPRGSPQKHTRFAALATAVPAPTVTASGHLAAPSHSYQTHVTSSPHRSPKVSSSSLAVPASRHRPSSSADSFFFLQANRPKGWYNRRGDRFVQKGVIERPPKHLEWHPTFGGYPEPGMGWMDENGHFLPMAGGILKN